MCVGQWVRWFFSHAEVLSNRSLESIITLNSKLPTGKPPNRMQACILFVYSTYDDMNFVVIQVNMKWRQAWSTNPVWTTLYGGPISICKVYIQLEIYLQMKTTGFQRLHAHICGVQGEVRISTVLQCSLVIRFLDSLSIVFRFSQHFVRCLISQFYIWCGSLPT